MVQNKQFEDLVKKGNTIGEVIAVDRFLISLRGLDSAPINSVVLFNDGNLGMVKEVREENTLVLSITTERVSIGQLAVLKETSFKMPVGEELLGTVIDPLGIPLNKKQLLNLPEKREIFSDAPSIIERNILNDQLPSGVSVVDTLFSIIEGQRIAILGDKKTGKTTLLTSTAINQKNTDKVIVYALIGKQKNELESLIRLFKKQGIMDKVVIVSANIMDPMPSIYLAPYSACAIAEHFWLEGRDCIVMYDDLSSHAKAYREISLLLKMNPGRDSYSSDIFHIHSSLLERAGKLKSNNRTLTAMPVVATPNNDITGYISTNIISITDGQIFFDTNVFQEGIRPAVNIGLSVSRIAERGRTVEQKKLADEVAKKLVSYEEAKQFARFGAKFSDNIKRDLTMGSQIHDFFQQDPEDLIGLVEQQIILQAILDNKGQSKLDMQKLKEKTREIVSQASAGEDIFSRVQELLSIAKVEA